MSHWTIPSENKYDYWLALYHGLVTRFPVKNRQALIDMRDNHAHTVHLWKETLCNNGENKAWFGNFKLQFLRCLWSETYSVGTRFLS